MSPFLLLGVLNMDCPWSRQQNYLWKTTNKFFFSSECRDENKALWSSDTFLFLQCTDCFWCNMSNWIWRIWQWICIWSWGQYNPPSPPTKGWNWPFGRIVKQLPHTRPRTCSKPTKQFAKCLKCFTIFTIMTKKIIDNLLNANPTPRIGFFVDVLHFLPNLTPSHLMCEPAH